jgi:hypothetical protein
MPGAVLQPQETMMTEWNDAILMVPDVTNWRSWPGGSRWEIEVQLSPGCDAVVRDDGGPTGVYVDMRICQGEDETEGATLFLPEAEARQLADDLMFAVDKLAAEQLGDDVAA